MAPENFRIPNHPELPGSLVEDYDISQASFPPEGPFFLKGPFISETCARLRMDQELTEAFQAAARAVSADQGLIRFAWHLHLRIRENKLSEKSPAWPFPNSIPMFYALAYLSCVPYALELNAKRGIDPSVTLDTLTDMEIWIRDYHSKKGVFGLKECHWFTRHFSGRIFRLGRLQFETKPFYRDLTAIRNRENGRIVVQAGSLECPSPGWETIAKLNDPSLAVHIPAMGPMDHAACGESFRRAARFFATHFPDYKYCAFTCESWLLNPDLEKILPPESNIVRFLKEWWLYPVPDANSDQTYDRVFGDPKIDLDKAPSSTSLQRAVLEFVRKGNRVKNGGGLMFPQNMAWGKQVYRDSLLTQ